MFSDSPKGQTHYQGDGCKDEHGKPIMTTKELEQLKREAEAGRKLAKQIEGFEVTPIACGSKEAQYVMNFLLAQIERHLKKFSSSYRSAVEIKE